MTSWWLGAHHHLPTHLAGSDPGLGKFRDTQALGEVARATWQELAADRNVAAVHKDMDNLQGLVTSLTNPRNHCKMSLMTKYWTVCVCACLIFMFYNFKPRPPNPRASFISAASCSSGNAWCGGLCKNEIRCRSKAARASSIRVGTPTNSTKAPRSDSSRLLCT